MRVVTRQRMQQWWMVGIQLVVPGFVLHELAHLVAGRGLLADARLIRTPAGRLQCLLLHDRPAGWRRFVVGFAPVLALWALTAAVSVLVVLEVVSVASVLSSPAAVLWLLLNAVVLGLPSRSDVRFALSRQ